MKKTYTLAGSRLFLGGVEIIGPSDADVVFYDPPEWSATLDGVRVTMTEESRSGDLLIEFRVGRLSTGVRIEFLDSRMKEWAGFSVSEQVRHAIEAAVEMMAAAAKMKVVMVFTRCAAAEETHEERLIRRWLHPQPRKDIEDCWIDDIDDREKP